MGSTGSHGHTHQYIYACDLKIINVVISLSVLVRA